jgi:hypothetical protein
VSGAAARDGAVTLDLRGGFAGDEVVVTLDGREVARATGVTTRPQTGRARSLPVAAGAEARRIGVAVPALGLSAEAALPPARPVWVAADLDDARRHLTLEVSARPFGYL